MQKIRAYIPKYVLKFFLKMSAIVLIFMLCRLVFLVFNWDFFEGLGLNDFFAGLWFDIITAAIIMLPLGFLEMLPNKSRQKKFYSIIFKLLFLITIFLSTLINLIDVGYFKFTSTRISATLLETLRAEGGGVFNQIFSYIINYWYLLGVLILFMLFINILYNKIAKIADDSLTTNRWVQFIYFVLVLSILVIIGRGGIGLKPIGPAKAAKYTNGKNIPLILNSAFTFIKTLGDKGVEKKFYFEEQELSSIFSLDKKFDTVAEIGKDNIVLIILESFSIEYINALNHTGKVYTPFIDSLINESLTFTQCFANGKRSVDAMPSLISSIPKLMNTELINSPYQTNQIESIPKKLSELNYNSSFFHGASNGSMNFDTYCNVAKFNNYYGRKEYNNEKHFDGTWGIFDHHFLPWCIEKIDEKRTPFFSTIFTISSHDPFRIPSIYEEKFNTGPSKTHNAISYVDFALSEFFEKAKASSWYNNTLFIITADHTPASGVLEYYSEIGKMRIPLIFYHPTNEMFHGKINKVVSQNDIMPTILDLTGYSKPFKSFGQSIFSDNEGYSASKIGESFLYFADLDTAQYLGIMHEDELTHLYFINDQLQTKNIINDSLKIAEEIEKHLKAMIQKHNDAMINNTLTP